MVVGHTDTDTDNDYTNTSGSSFQSSKSKKAKKDNSVSKSAHLNFTDALSALRAEEIHSETTQQSQDNAIATQPDDLAQGSQDNASPTYGIFEYPDEEPEEFDIDRQIRIQREAEGRQTVRPSAFLTSPPDEVRRRKRARAINLNQDDATAQLREHQRLLVVEQAKLNLMLMKNAEIAHADAHEQLKRSKILTQNAILAQEETKERIKLLKIQVQIAEKELGHE